MLEKNQKEKNTGFQKEKDFVDRFNTDKEFKNKLLCKINIEIDGNYTASLIQDYLEQNKMKLKYKKHFGK